MLWCPPSESKSDNEHGVTPVVEQSRTETAAEVKVSLEEVAPVEGVFLRQWGTKGNGESEFEYPSGVCANGEEVFVCDEVNHRIQVFSRDGTVATAALSASLFSVGLGRRRAGTDKLSSERRSERRGSVCARFFVLNFVDSFIRQWGVRGSV